MENINFDSLKRRRDLRIILPVFLVSIIACIDRVNISYAKLTMTQTLAGCRQKYTALAPASSLPVTCCWKSPVPSLPLSFRRRMDCPHHVHLGRRQPLHGLRVDAVAILPLPLPLRSLRSQPLSGHLFPLIPPLVHGSRTARATSLMLTSLLLSTIVGAPIAGVLLEHSFFGLLGWQELFILESIRPSSSPSISYWPSKTVRTKSIG